MGSVDCILLGSTGSTRPGRNTTRLNPPLQIPGRQKGVFSCGVAGLALEERLLALLLAALAALADAVRLHPHWGPAGRELGPALSQRRLERQRLKWGAIVVRQDVDPGAGRLFGPAPGVRRPYP